MGTATPIAECELTDGLDDTAGIGDAAAFTIDGLAALAKVANDLRSEWETIAGVYPDLERTESG